MKDDLGFAHTNRPPKRVVSLVPSTTESVALTAPELLVGATDYCVHPPQLDLPRVGGSKYPKLDRIFALQPDLVLANAEENRKSDVEALREAGISVWVGFPSNVLQACRSAERMFTGALHIDPPNWTREAARLWQTPPSRQINAVIPIWRKPWMVLGPNTFATDVLHRLGVTNIFDTAQEPYPKVKIDEILSAHPQMVVLPDEPYTFSITDGPEAFAGIECALVSGRHLTWHGPSLLEAHQLLNSQLDHTITTS